MGHFLKIHFQEWDRWPKGRGISKLIKHAARSLRKKSASSPAPPAMNGDPGFTVTSTFYAVV